MFYCGGGIKLIKRRRDIKMLASLICFYTLMLALLAVYLYFDIAERRAKAEFLRRKTRARDRRIDRDFNELNEAIWDSCRFSTNHIIREIKKAK